MKVRSLTTVPTVVILHGLTGGSQESYVRHAVEEAQVKLWHHTLYIRDHKRHWILLHYVWGINLLDFYQSILIWTYFSGGKAASASVQLSAARQRRKKSILTQLYWKWSKNFTVLNEIDDKHILTNLLCFYIVVVHWFYK